MKLVLTILANHSTSLLIGLLTAAFLGPEEFGRFALVMLAASFIQLSAFDWLRLSAARFYSGLRETEDGLWRASLDRGFTLVASALCALTLVYVSLMGVTEHQQAFIMALPFALANGFFDYHAALLRACFNDRLYSRLIASKLIISLIITLGLAYDMRTAFAPLIGLSCAPLFALMMNWRAMNPPKTHHARARGVMIKQAAAYSWPLILAMVIASAMALMNRSFISIMFNYSETGQFSLPYDLGVRLFNALGLSFDFMFFQIAVRHDDIYGRAKAQEQLRLNLTYLTALLTPAFVGLWLIMPALEETFITTAFHDSFAVILSLLLPGFYCSILAQYGINPFFQMAHRTSPIIMAALIGLITNIIFLAWGGDHLAISDVALIQSCASFVTLITLAFIALRQNKLWTSWRDLCFILAGIILMSCALWPLRSVHTGAFMLLSEIILGMSIYGLFLWAVNFRDVRGQLHQFIQKK